MLILSFSEMSLIFNKLGMTASGGNTLSARRSFRQNFGRAADYAFERR